MKYFIRFLNNPWVNLFVGYGGIVLLVLLLFVLRFELDVQSFFAGIAVFAWLAMIDFGFDELHRRKKK